MKTFFSIILICAFTIGTDAQTKRIAHRSHSGTKNSAYEKGHGGYGLGPQKVRIHLESGRDTMVNSWDSLANPIFFPDTVVPKKPVKIEKIGDMGRVTGKLS